MKEEGSLNQPQTWFRVIPMQSILPNHGDWKAGCNDIGQLGLIPLPERWCEDARLSSASTLQSANPNKNPYSDGRDMARGARVHGRFYLRPVVSRMVNRDWEQGLRRVTHRPPQTSRPWRRGHNSSRGEHTT